MRNVGAIFVAVNAPSLLRFRAGEFGILKERSGRGNYQLLEVPLHCDAMTTYVWLLSQTVGLNLGSAVGIIRDRQRMDFVGSPWRRKASCAGVSQRCGSCLRQSRRLLSF